MNKIVILHATYNAYLSFCRTVTSLLISPSSCSTCSVISIGSNFGGSLIGWNFSSLRNFSVDEQATVKATYVAHICNW